MDFSLDRIKKVLQLLNNPQDKYLCIHVAGTNGKGSVCSYLESILMNCNIDNNLIKVGKYNSPHLLTENDAIRINNKSISKEDYELKKLEIKQLSESNSINLTNFELTTVIMFYWFSINKIDIGIIEVGLGGLLDATNVISSPLACVFTSISMDHENILGNNLNEIAIQKSGILKPNAIAIIGRQKYNECLDTLKHQCEINDNKYILADEAQVVQDFDYFKLPSKPSIVKYFSTYTNNTYHFELPLYGQFQLSNVALVIETILVIKDEVQFNISNDNITSGIKQTSWPGRLQFIKKQENLFLLDGAHNPDSAIELNKFINKIKDNQPKLKLYWIIASTKGKDFKSNILNLFKGIKHSSIHLVPFTQPDAMPWINSMDTKEMQNIIKSTFNLDAFIYNDSKHAIDDINFNFIKSESKDGHLIIVTGSLYLVADFFRLFGISY